MTVQNLRKPSLLYGLGVRSPFATYTLVAEESELLAWLEEHQLRSYLPFEEALVSSVELSERTVSGEVLITVSGAQRLFVNGRSRITLDLQGSPVEDIDVSVVALDVRADTDIIIDAEPSRRSAHLIYASVAEGAVLRINDLIISEHDSFRRVVVSLDDSASVYPNHAFLLSGEGRLDLKSDVTHIGRDSFSDMKMRGVLAGSSQVIVQGDVTIKPTAFDANGYQQEDLILASPRAIARPIPNLEIGNNEVKCSHGATVSSVDPEQVFYLRSRGLSEEDAKGLLLSSFVEPILDLFAASDHDRIRSKMRGIIDASR